MRSIVFTDLHLGIHNNSEIWLDKSILLAKTIREYGIKNNISRIYCLGDFFNDRRSLNTKTIDTAIEFLEILKDFSIYMVIGNHDTYFKNTSDVHSLRMFTKFEHVHIVEHRMHLEDDQVTLVSWGTESIGKSDKSILMGHFEINGAKMNNAMVVETAELSPKDFSSYELVLSGHYHTPSINGNVRYIGSVMPFTFNDVDSPRGFYELNSKDYSLKFIEFEDAPKYVIQYSDKKIDKDLIKGNIVKLVFVSELSTEEIDSLIASIQILNPLFFQTEFKNVNVSDEYIDRDESLVELKDNMQIFDEYIDKIKLPDHIDINVLKSKLMSLSNPTI